MKLCQAGDEQGVMRLLRELVPEYKPSKQVVPFPVAGRNVLSVAAAEPSNRHWLKSGSRSLGISWILAPLFIDAAANGFST